MKIWTENESIEVNQYCIEDLIKAMRFKASHIKAKADPELFEAVASALEDLLTIKLLMDLNNKTS